MVGAWGLILISLLFSSIEAVDLKESAPYPLMVDSRTQQPKFYLYSYQQQKDGFDVFGAEARVLVRNVKNFPVVLKRSTLADLKDFKLDAQLIAVPNHIKSFSNIRLKFPLANKIDREARMMIYPAQNLGDTAKLVLVYSVMIGEPGSIDYENWQVLTNAATGEILHAENQIVHNVLHGTILGMGTEGYKSSSCSPDLPQPLPYLRVSVDTDETFTDSQGLYSFASLSGVSNIVNASMNGLWFSVFNRYLSGTTLSSSFSIGGSANFLFNPNYLDPMKSEPARAEVNAYLSANEARDYVLAYKPDFKYLDTEVGFPIHVNMKGTCNAYFDNKSINFFSSGGGCANSAFSKIVYHEYGHNLVQNAGSGQGAYGEGYADSIANIVSGEAAMGIGLWTNNCDTSARSAINQITYPCSKEDHYCGQVLSGSFWDTFEEFKKTTQSLSKARDLISRLVLNSVFLHIGDQINPQIGADLLVLDDDDNDISNGTPHLTEIYNGFIRHHMIPAEIEPLKFSLDRDRPELVSPNGGEAFKVTVHDAMVPANTLISATLNYRLGIGDFIKLPLRDLGNKSYAVDFPPTVCQSVIHYFLSFKTSTGLEVRIPALAPTDTFELLSATSGAILFHDDFQKNRGWNLSTDASSQRWSRGSPNGEARGGPAADYDQSGSCFSTSGSFDDSIDVKSGHWTLTSPSVELPFLGKPIVSYARWYSNDRGSSPHSDVFNVIISLDGGTNWRPLETIGPNGSETAGGWVKKHFNLERLHQGSQIKVRFVLNDEKPMSSLEAGVDDFYINIATCDSTNSQTGAVDYTNSLCLADFNENGVVDAEDYLDFIGAFDEGNREADMDQNHFVNGDDFDLFARAYSNGCNP